MLACASYCETLVLRASVHVLRFADRGTGERPTELIRFFRSDRAASAGHRGKARILDSHTSLFAYTRISIPPVLAEETTELYIHCGRCPPAQRDRAHICSWKPVFSRARCRLPHVQAPIHRVGPVLIRGSHESLTPLYLPASTASVGSYGSACSNIVMRRPVLRPVRLGFPNRAPIARPRHYAFL